jgi:hypothetical protein
VHVLVALTGAARVLLLELLEHAAVRRLQRCGHKQTMLCLLV